MKMTDTLINNKTKGKRTKSIWMAWWNDKGCATTRATTVRDKFMLLLEERNLDILCISEANVWADDHPFTLNIKGYDIINDKLLKAFGRSRSAIYVRKQIK